MRARNRYVPVPASGTNVVLGSVVSFRRNFQVVEPGRCTCTSYAYPIGGGSSAHRTVNVDAVVPEAGDTWIGAFNVPRIVGWIAHWNGNEPADGTSMPMTAPAGCGPVSNNPVPPASRTECSLGPANEKRTVSPNVAYFVVGENAKSFTTTGADGAISHVHLLARVMRAPLASTA